MSASLLLRELKRLLSLTLAAVILPAFIYATILVLRQTALAKDVPDIDDARGLALALAVLIAPWILGAASFAPERESGAASFLARLPLPGWKLLLTRFAAILACLACVHGPVWGLAWAWDLPRRSLGILVGASVGSLALLGAATYASLSLKRSLSAFAAGPILVWSGFWVVTLPWVLFGYRLREEELVGGSALLVVGAVACLAWAAKAQKPLSGLHPIRFTWRPLVVLCLLNAGTAGAITLVDKTTFRVSTGTLFRTEGGTLGQTLSGDRGSRRVVQTARVAISRGGKVALLPEGHVLVGLNDTMVFTHAWHPRSARKPSAALWRLDDLIWCDPEQPRGTPLEVANFEVSRLERDYGSEGPLGHCGMNLLWAGEVPCEVRWGRLESATGEKESAPARWEVRASGGSSVIARTPEGEFRLFQLEHRGLHEFSNPAAWIDLAPLFPGLVSLDDVVTSSSGESLLGYGRDASGWVVAGLDLRAPQPRAEVFLRPTAEFLVHWADPAIPSAVVLWEDAAGQGKTYNPRPVEPLGKGLFLPVSEGKSYFLVGDEVRYGTPESSSSVDLFD